MTRQRKKESMAHHTRMSFRSLIFWSAVMMTLALWYTKFVSETKSAKLPLRQLFLYRRTFRILQTYCEEPVYMWPSGLNQNKLRSPSHLVQKNRHSNKATVVVRRRVAGLAGARCDNRAEPDSRWRSVRGLREWRQRTRGLAALCRPATRLVC